MNEITREWVAKAEGDFRLAFLAFLALRSEDEPIPDGACFHSQQRAEKYLKAYLQEIGEIVPRSHALIPLLTLCLQFDREFENYRGALLDLENYAVAVRYPGVTVSVELAESALEAASQVRAFLRKKLALP